MDVLLVRQGLAESREKAKAVIMAGCVYVNDQKEDKAGAMFDETKVSLEVRGNTLRYVSRSRRRLKCLACSSTERFVWISAHRQAVSQTVCSKMAQKRCIL